MLNVEKGLSSLQEPRKSIFKYLSEEEKVELENHLTRVNVKRNDLIFKEGDRPQGFITLEDGKVKIFKEGVGGREQILRMVKPGGFVSYRALIAGEPHIASAVALEDSVICLIESDYFFTTLLKNDALTLRLLTKLAKELGFSNSRTVTLTQKHIRGRLAESLILLMQKYGVEPDGTTVKAYLSREDLANLSNMTTSNAIRTLSSFVNEKIIAIDGRKVKILDAQKLDHISKMG
ncbi:MAG: Crp/Fnr family transcriptional regulator [Prolixibacteraceae bacterium]|jgi:CRP-like cAMP-binding protein|nr:Crp/Fnr family transcriptional regulator [Prolixibacteraceae bacterium]